MLRNMLCLLVIVSGVVSPVIAQGEPTAQPTDWLNVRTGPGTQYDVLDSVAPGTTLVMEARDGAAGWVLMHTADGNLYGWVSTCCIVTEAQIDALPVSVPSEEAPPAQAQEEAPAAPAGTAQTTTALRMRAGPGEDHDTITILPKSTAVILGERSANGVWVHVQTADGVYDGWVSTCCVRAAETAETVEAAGAAPAESAPPPVPEMPASQPVAYTVMPWTLHSKPYDDAPVIAQIGEGEVLSLGQRSPDGRWFYVHTEDGQAGWFSTCCIRYPQEGASSADVPVTDPHYWPATVLEADLVAKLKAVPILPALSPRVHEIFAHGQSLGNRADVFAKVGDCTSEFDAFLLPFGVGEYDLGPYANLQPTVDFFSQTPARPGSANAFANRSLAASSGFSAGSVLEPFWAAPDLCQAGETPLACEYRLTKPAAAIILFGTVDVHYLPPVDFKNYLRYMVEYSISNGVIPVLNTIPADRRYMWRNLLELSAVVVDVANEYQVPVVNLWLATQGLPDGGIDTSDHQHLSYDGSRGVAFNGSEGRWGYDMRNLVTLQMLDKLRREVLAR